MSGGIFDLYEIVPGFILNLIVAVVVSMMGKLTTEIEDEFDAAMVKIKEL